MAVAGWTHQELAASVGNLGPCVLGLANSLLRGKAAGSVPLAAPHFLNFERLKNDFSSTSNGSGLSSA